MHILSHSRMAILAISVLAGYSATALAEKTKPLMDKNKFSVGVGVSSNSVDGPVDDETGFQFFAAYDLTAINLMEDIGTSVEAGYMDYGFDGSDSDGVWAALVVDGKFTGQFGWLGRLGYDFGDDDGFMLGAGVGYSFANGMEIRGEYVARDNIDSLQLNFLIGM